MEAPPPAKPHWNDKNTRPRFNRLHMVHFKYPRDQKAPESSFLEVGRIPLFSLSAFGVIRMGSPAWKWQIWYNKRTKCPQWAAYGRVQMSKTVTFPVFDTFWVLGTFLPLGKWAIRHASLAGLPWRLSANGDSRRILPFEASETQHATREVAFVKTKPRIFSAEPNLTSRSNDNPILTFYGAMRTTAQWNDAVFYEWPLALVNQELGVPGSQLVEALFQIRGWNDIKRNFR